MRRRNVVNVDADHGLAQPAGHLGQHVRIVVERGGLDDGCRPRRGVAGLEDPGTDEHSVGTELHHHRRVRRSRNAARGEHRHGELAGPGHLGDKFVGRL